MSYRNFDEFLIRLEQNDRVEFLNSGHGQPEFGKPGSTAVTVLMDRSSGVAIVRNAFASRQRVAWALQVEQTDEVVARLEKMLDLSRPHTFSSLMDRASDLMSSLRIVPFARRRTDSDLRSVGLDRLTKIFDLARDPLTGTVFFVRDDRPYWGVHVAAAGADDRVVILSPYPMKAGERAVVTLGGDPAALIAALMPLPASVHRSYFTGWLRKRPPETMRLDDPQVDVPANVECVLVGTVEHVDGTTDAQAAPDRVRYAAEVTVQEMWLRPNPVLVSLSGHDVTILRDAMIEMSLPLIRLAVPELRAVKARGGLVRIEVDGGTQAALRSAYSFLASPFADGVRWIVTCSACAKAVSRAELPDASALHRIGIAVHPDHGWDVPVFVESNADARTDPAAWMPDYALAVLAWRGASNEMED